MLASVLRSSKEADASKASKDGSQNGVVTVVTDDGTRFAMSTENANTFAVNKIIGGKLMALEQGGVLIAPNPDGSFSGLVAGRTYAAHYVPDPTIHDPRQMVKKLALKQKPMSRKQVMSIFSHFDTDCSGAIDRDEFRAMAATMDLHMEGKDIDAVFTVVDLDKNGTIEFEEFYDWLINTKKKGNILKSGLKKLATRAGFMPQDNPEKILEIFNRIDTDKSGAIDPDEFRALVKDLKLKLDDVEVMALFRSIDLDGNGTLEFNEFLTWWQDSVSGNSTMSDAAWQVRLGLSESELEAATGMKKPAPAAHKEEEKDEKKKDKKKGDDDDDSEKEDEKETEVVAPRNACALKWTNVETVGEKWHVPGKGKKEKGLQGVQYCEHRGVVSLRGCLISEGGASAVAFTLPADRAPSKHLRFNTFVNSGKKSEPADVVITPDGKVTVSSTNEGEFWFSGISYDQ